MDCDKDGSGDISTKELKKALPTPNLNPNPSPSPNRTHTLTLALP